MIMRSMRFERIMFGITMPRDFEIENFDKDQIIGDHGK